MISDNLILHAVLQALGEREGGRIVRISTHSQVNPPCKIVIFFEDGHEEVAEIDLPQNPFIEQAREFRDFSLSIRPLKLEGIESALED